MQIENMIRRIVEDYEAKLKPVDPARFGEKARGKAEWERYGNDEEELSVSIRNVNLPDGSELDAYLNSGFVGRIALRGGYGKLEIGNNSGQAAPRAGVGSTMTVSFNGAELLKGTFVKD